MRRSNDQGSMIIGLTHTEVMLIFAIAALILLLIKHSAFNEKEADNLRLSADNLRIKEELVEMRGQEETAEEIETRLIEEDMGKEVLDILVENGKISRDKPLSELKEEVIDSVSHLIEQNKQAEDFTREIDEILSFDGSASDGDSSEKNPDRLDKIRKNAAAIEKIGDAVMPKDVENATSAADVAEQVEKIIADNNEKQGQDKADSNLSQKQKFVNKFGWLPCWYNEKGNPDYYVSYDITYDALGDKYQIKPHKHWKSSNVIVRVPVDGGLPALKDYPRGWVSAEILQRFGVRLNQNKIKVYGKECRLAADLNEEATGVQVKFIRDKVHLYPIYK